MACSVDWGALGTWVTGWMSASAGLLGALGTWATGAAAAAIALQVYRASKKGDRERAEVERRRLLAYRMACRMELLALKVIAEATVSEMERALRSEQFHRRYGALRVFAEMRSFAPPRWVTTSPMLGHMSEEAAQAIVTAFAAANDMDRLRVHMKALLRTVEDEALERPIFDLVRSSTPAVRGYVNAARAALTHVE